MSCTIQISNSSLRYLVFRITSIDIPTNVTDPTGNLIIYEDLNHNQYRYQTVIFIPAHANDHNLIMAEQKL